MGHSTAVMTVSIDTANEIRQNLAANKMRHSSWYSRPTFTSELVRAAVADWRDDPDMDRGDSRSGSGSFAPMLSARAADWYIATHHGLVVDESVVIPVAADKDVIVKSQDVRVEVDAALLTKLRSGDYTGMDKLREQLYATYGDALVTVELAKLPAARKPKAAATEGKAVTKYDVVGIQTWGQKYVLATEDSQSEARATAIRLMTENDKLAELTVEARIVRENGSPALVTITRPEPETAAITVRVTTHKVREGAEPIHYVVAFDYHH